MPSIFLLSDLIDPGCGKPGIEIKQEIVPLRCKGPADNHGRGRHEGESFQHARSQTGCFLEAALMKAALEQGIIVMTAR